MNFQDVTSAPIPKEFLAIILAGFGNELHPLTGNHGDEPCPKALLPIANKPMISYTLTWIEESGIQDVLIVCPATHREALSNYLQSDEFSSTLVVNFEAYDSNDPSTGAMEVLAAAAPRCQTDFVLLSCDFIPHPSLPLSSVLNEFRVATDGALAISLFYEASVLDKSEEVAFLEKPPVVIVDPSTSSLLHVDYSHANEEELDLRMSLTWKFPRTRLLANFTDSHVYVCRRAVLDLIVDRAKGFDSFREDFVPWLCKLQYQRRRREKFTAVLSHNIRSSPSSALRHSTRYSASSKRDRTVAPTSSDTSDDEGPLEQTLRCGALLHRAKDGYVTRTNNLYAYSEANRRVLATVLASAPAPSGKPAPSQNADSLIAESSRVGERTSVKKSVVGRHCTIGKNVKIAGSVIGDHCIILDGAHLENCILSQHTRVGEKAELIRCQTQAGLEVEAGAKFKGEKLEVDSWAEGHGDSEEEGSESESE
ncbi:nucleotide-diphospho-sugar transferase [Sistotremastrum niveocremeum HHB9708]|uniref:Translation initiation factor eIF2B subunit gamma n=1 Tax=Sistotremastrum niveocremeum HHB9708 TaxID=1314777 RepID=A0A165A707_9AGAM|nr:nucleotide-diphospho-sugar transferase [Sistotremastrum niveocremeum HHB9708]